MGEIAELMINGELCQTCGAYIDDDSNQESEPPGFARDCEMCSDNEEEK